MKVSNFPDISGLFISQMNSHIMIENTCLTIFIANLDKYLKSHSLMKLLLLIAFQNHRVGIFRKYEVAVRFATSFVKASRSNKCPNSKNGYLGWNAKKELIGQKHVIMPGNIVLCNVTT